MNNVFSFIKKYRFLLFILAVIPMFVFRDFTRNNELRYMSIADEALRNGNFFTFTNHGINYADKPPLYLWIVMLGKTLFGTHSMLFLAMFSYIPALVIIYIMGKWVGKTVPGKSRLAGEIMLLTSVFFIGSAVVLRMDMLMCMFIVLSLYTFFRIYSGEAKKRDSWLFPLYVFMAIFSKGPIGILVPLVSTILFLLVKKDIKSIGRYWGVKTLGVLIGLCAVWFTGVFLEGGPEYLNNLLFNQTINRAVDSFHHKEPFFYYMIAIWYSLAPWAFLMIGVLVAGLVKKVSSTDLEKFFLVIALSTFTVLSLVSSKIQVYMLPAFPFFAYITALWLPKFEDKKFVKILLGVPAFVMSLAIAGLLAAYKFTDFPVFESFLIPVTATIVSITGLITLWILYRKSIYNAIISMGAGLLLAVFTISFYIPQYNPNIGMRAVSEQAQETALEHGIFNYLSYNIPRIENIDVYIGVVPRDVTIEELEERVNAAKSIDSEAAEEQAVLFIMQSELKKDEKLAKLLEGKEKYPVGYFYYVIL